VPEDLSVITQPVFVANGDHDLIVDSSHSADMARRLPNARLTIYPDSGYGGVFQTDFSRGVVSGFRFKRLLGTGGRHRPM